MDTNWEADRKWTRMKESRLIWLLRSRRFAVCFASRPFAALFASIRGPDPFPAATSNYLREENLVVFRSGRVDSGAGNRTCR
jgi:hypothetical protein